MKKKISRFLSLVLLVVFSAALLAGCGSKLPEGYDEDELKASAEVVINLLNQRDSVGLNEMMTEDMKAGLTEEVQAQIFAFLDESGTMKEISSLGVSGSEENGITFAVVIAKVAYENRDITYTIGFDPDMKLAGLYLQ
ncbi:MAG: DUF3887 domain-containing protein [Anaerolineaceae bacterium]|nr:DUF3887 domain-containing protein [Anaerolineaceae bacterium]